MSQIQAVTQQDAVNRARSLYRAVWRWHFYAGLIVAPFLLILAVTGAIYLFSTEINDALYPEQRFVEPSATPVPVSRLVDEASRHFPGSTAIRVDMPTEPGRSATVFVMTPAGQEWRLYMHPGTAEVLGSFVYTRTLVGFADVFHGSLLLGDFGDAIVELMACWALVLIATGLYLWWPRAGSTLGRAVPPQAGARGRMAWRGWHAFVGLWTAPLIVFLIMTGLPWATIWGDFLRSGMEFAGIGRPVAQRLLSSVPDAPTHAEALTAVPWTLEAEPMPVSDPHAGHGGVVASAVPLNGSAISVDDAVRILGELGMDDAFRLSLPLTATGTYMAYTYPDQPQGQHTVHLDQYSGAVVYEVRFSDYGWGAKAVELGVQLHMGNYFGRLNQALMLLACMGVIALALTGPIMWWKRRPPGKLAAPRTIAPLQLRTLALLTFGLVLVFPLAGISLALVLAADMLIERIRPLPMPNNENGS